MSHLKAHKQTFIDFQDRFTDLANQLETVFSTAERTIQDSLYRLQRGIHLAENEMEEAREALRLCHDNRRSDCHGEEFAFYVAQVRVQNLLNALNEFEYQVKVYENLASTARQLVDTELPHCKHQLFIRETIVNRLWTDLGSLHSRKSGSAQSSSAGGSSTQPEALQAVTLINLLSKLGGGHGGKYRSARQQFLKGLANDPKQPAFVRGWVKQEINRIEQVNRAKSEGRLTPGGNKRHIRGIPGMDVGHRIPDIDVPDNFRLEEAAMNRSRPHIARRLGIQDFIR